ncbi:MAG: DUF3108 domain-containing protein [Bryobacteraceae bacterium]
MRFVLSGRSAGSLAAVLALFAGAIFTSQPAAAGDLERFSFDVQWRLIRAGTVVIDATPDSGRIKLDSAGLVSALFKIDDTYTVHYEPGRCATDSLMNAQEGKRHRETKITFDRTLNKGTSVLRDLRANTILRQDQIDIPNCVHDVLGALLMLRNTRMDLGKSATFPVSDGRRAAQVKVDAQEREDVSTAAGTFHTIRYEAGLLNGVVYQRNGRVQLWLSDDARRLPVKVLVRMGFPVGNVTLELTKEEQP